MVTMVTTVENVEQREEGLREHYRIRRKRNNSSTEAIIYVLGAIYIYI